MSCFWDGLIKALRAKNLIAEKLTPNELLNIVKYFNKKNSKVFVNGNKTTLLMQKENVARINEIKQVNDGYDCSSHDPVLMLIARIYKINIDHHFNGTLIKYTIKDNINSIIVYSDSSHFWS